MLLQRPCLSVLPSPAGPAGGSQGVAGSGLGGINQGGNLVEGPGSCQKVNPSSAEVRARSGDRVVGDVRRAPRSLVAPPAWAWSG